MRVMMRLRVFNNRCQSRPLTSTTLPANGAKPHGIPRLLERRDSQILPITKWSLQPMTSWGWRIVLMHWRGPTPVQTDSHPSPVPPLHPGSRAPRASSRGATVSNDPREPRAETGRGRRDDRCGRPWVLSVSAYVTWIISLRRIMLIGS